MSIRFILKQKLKQINLWRNLLCNVRNILIYQIYWQYPVKSVDGKNKNFTLTHLQPQRFLNFKFDNFSVSNFKCWIKFY